MINVIPDRVRKAFPIPVGSFFRGVKPVDHAVMVAYPEIVIGMVLKYYAQRHVFINRCIHLESVVHLVILQNALAERSDVNISISCLLEARQRGEVAITILYWIGVDIRPVFIIFAQLPLRGNPYRSVGRDSEHIGLRRAETCRIKRSHLICILTEYKASCIGGYHESSLRILANLRCLAVFRHREGDYVVAVVSTEHAFDCIPHISLRISISGCNFPGWNF